ncbi:hypothetical protein [Gudongella sp. DL1XJH-153]|uniref:hypothetical protein n=1 Tax=Gudongella sp. DL1XJH-153 TaxID=3409804 RepID=UPI003BB7412F
MSETPSVSQPTIVVIAYNRPKSLELLLKSLSCCDYDDKNTRIVISIDGGTNQLNNEVKKVADDYKWIHGEKIVLKHEKNLGLRAHILKAGDLVNKYGSIIMLEDDLYVSKYFYHYSKHAIQHYSLDERVAGVSLYAQQYNETAGKIFQPLISGKDTYFMQLASSWGQIWTKQQWSSFIEWYEQNKDISFSECNTPPNLSSWPASSWKKYFIRYLIESDKFFVYPYVSLTTNMREKGVHAKSQDNLLQVPLLKFNKKNYDFDDFKESSVVYDAFHENIRLRDYLKKSLSDEVTIDIYGTKENSNTRYVLTTRIMNKKIIKGYSLKMFPQEENVLCDLYGKDIFLYDTFINEKFDIDSKINIRFRNLEFYFLRIPLGKKRSLTYLILSLVKKMWN